MDRETIDANGWPLAFRADDQLSDFGSDLSRGYARAAVRALAGMQKEAIVAVGDAGTWRFACDEGHYLNGTDLAPPPLDYFSAGMQFSMLSSALDAARARGVRLRSLGLELDNVYHIEGSFLRGDAKGSAEAPRLRLVVDADGEGDAHVENLLGMLRDAAAMASALAIAREVLANRFRLAIRGRPTPLDGMREIREGAGAASIEGVFARCRPGPSPAEPVVRKTSEAERVENHRDGAGVGLTTEQRRTIHIRSRGDWLDERRFRADVDLLRPIGSSFRFHADSARPAARTPPPEAFVAAGIALCFMTQLGRYATIRRRPLEGYSVLQENGFRVEDGRAAALPVNTTVLLESDRSAEEGADLVRTSERTCFLHACMRSKLEPELTLAWKGETLRP